MLIKKSLDFGFWEKKFKFLVIKFSFFVSDKELINFKYTHLLILQLQNQPKILQSK